MKFFKTYSEQDQPVAWIDKNERLLILEQQRHQITLLSEICYGTDMIYKLLYTIINANSLIPLLKLNFKDLYDFIS